MPAAAPRTCARGHLLEVVENQEHPAIAHVLGERFEHGFAGLLAQADRVSDRGHDELPVAHLSERDEEDAVVERLDQ